MFRVERLVALDPFSLVFAVAQVTRFRITSSRLESSKGDIYVNKVESKPGSAVTPQRIMGMAWGYSAPLIMESAIKHKVFDVLDDGAKTADEVARATGVSLRGVRMIMNAMVALE